MPSPEDDTPGAPPPPPPGEGESTPLDDNDWPEDESAGWSDEWTEAAGRRASGQTVTTSSYEAPRPADDDDGSVESVASEWDPVLIGSADEAEEIGSRELLRPGKGRSLKRRALDWAIGAAAMLLLLLAVAWLAWLSITRPAGDDTAEATPPPTPSSTETATPPADLAEGQVWLGDVDFESGSLVAAGTPLLDVTAHGTDVTSGPDGLRAGYLEVTATVPFDAVAAELEPGTVVESAGNGEARIETAVEVLGRDLDVIAEGTVEVVDGELLIEPTTMELGGTGFLSELLGALVKDLITIQYAIPGLPEGLVLQSVEVMDEGFRAHLAGEDVQLSG